MNSTMVVKQGTPSKPGETVDTDAAKVVPTSPEVRQEVADREVAEQKKQTRAKIGELAKGMTGAHAANKAALDAALLGKPAKRAKAKPAAKGSTKPKPAVKPRGAGNGAGPTARLTTEWIGSDKKDVRTKDRVTMADGTSIEIIGRWTKHTKDGGLIPMVTGRVLLAGGKKGNRKNAVAAEVTHFPAAKKEVK
jgi:hypothetical protein